MVNILIFVIELSTGHSHIMIRTIKPLINKCVLLEASVPVALSYPAIQHYKTNKGTLWHLHVIPMNIKIQCYSMLRTTEVTTVLS